MRQATTYHQYKKVGMIFQNEKNLIKQTNKFLIKVKLIAVIAVAVQKCELLKQKQKGVGSIQLWVVNAI